MLDEYGQQFDNYIITYRLDGSEWCLDVPATSVEDAKRRLTAALRGEISGKSKLDQGPESGSEAHPTSKPESSDD